MVSRLHRALPPSLRASPARRILSCCASSESATLDAFSLGQSDSEKLVRRAVSAGDLVAKSPGLLASLSCRSPLGRSGRSRTRYRTQVGHATGRRSDAGTRARGWSGSDALTGQVPPEKTGWSTCCTAALSRTDAVWAPTDERRRACLLPPIDPPPHRRTWGPQPHLLAARCRQPRTVACGYLINCWPPLIDTFWDPPLINFDSSPLNTTRDIFLIFMFFFFKKGLLANLSKIYA